MLIDVHSHVNFNAYKDDADETLKRALDNGIWVNSVGSQITTSRRAVEMAEKYDTGVFATVGLHPMHLSTTRVDINEADAHFMTRAERFDRAAYEPLTQSKKTLAVGEIGLDYFHLAAPEIADKEAEKAKQKETFRAQIALARDVGLPLMLHCRDSREHPEDAYWDMHDILKQEIGWMKVPGMLHCFTSSERVAKAFIDIGFYIGFTGIITFPNAKKLQVMVAALPLERILTETDCPYLTPAPHRGKRNEPAYVKFVAEKIAELKNLHLAEVEKQTFENAHSVFSKLY
ncbi:MAG: TatD family hydrolase [Patescibacteria group bacterium]